jgi:hypothetical protein
LAKEVLVFTTTFIPFSGPQLANLVCILFVGKQITLNHEPVVI